MLNNSNPARPGSPPQPAGQAHGALIREAAQGLSGEPTENYSSGWDNQLTGPNLLVIYLWEAEESLGKEKVKSCHNHINKTANTLNKAYMQNYRTEQKF